MTNLLHQGPAKPDGDFEELGRVWSLGFFWFVDDEGDSIFLGFVEVLGRLVLSRKNLKKMENITKQ